MVSLPVPAKATAPTTVIVDMAAETGGNVEGSLPDQVVDVNGVTIVGTANLANLAPRDATQMYASNMFNLVEDTLSLIHI